MQCDAVLCWRCAVFWSRPHGHGYLDSFNNVRTNTHTHTRARANTYSHIGHTQQCRCTPRRTQARQHTRSGSRSSSSSSNIDYRPKLGRCGVGELTVRVRCTVRVAAELRVPDEYLGNVWILCAVETVHVSRCCMGNGSERCYKIASHFAGRIQRATMLRLLRLCTRVHQVFTMLNYA